MIQNDQNIDYIKAVDYNKGNWSKDKVGEIMKIRIALLDSDVHYLNRIAAAFSGKYADKLEVYSFTKQEGALEALEPNKIDVLIASEFFDIDVSVLPKRCGFAYFVENQDVDTIKDEPAICKFQKADLIYKQILSIYSENASNISGIKISDENSNLIAFVSPSGGVGTSTLAAAYAVACARSGKGVFYLNLETFGTVGSFFSAESQFDMSDIIYTLKSKKANLALKIESCINQDETGVCFFSPSKIALDMMELGKDEIIALIHGLQLLGRFQTIVLDMNFGLDSKAMEVYKHMSQIILVGDGTEISNAKLTRAYEALVTLEQGMDFALCNKIAVLYNKFSNKTGRFLEGADLKPIGGTPRFERASAKQIMMQIAGMGVFLKLI